MRDAICTVCGLVRTCKQPRNRDYITETGDLKCAHCGRITRHAILESAAHAKMAQLRREQDDLILRGDDPAAYGREPWNLAERRAKYRLQQPQNPLLDHIWSAHSMAEACKNGEQRVAAYCGAMVPVLSDDRTRAISPRGQVEVSEYGEHEASDGETWTDMDCVDCARIVNERRRRRRRDDVVMRLATAILPYRDRLQDRDLDALEAVLDRIQRTT